LQLLENPGALGSLDDDDVFVLAEAEADEEDVLVVDDDDDDDDDVEVEDTEPPSSVQRDDAETHPVSLLAISLA